MMTYRIIAECQEPTSASQAAELQDSGENEKRIFFSFFVNWDPARLTWKKSGDQKDLSYLAGLKVKSK